MKVLISFLMIATAVATLICAQEESASPAEEAKTYPEVPKQYEVGEDTISPDGRFGILYPVRDENSNEGPAFPNVLARLKPYEVIKELDLDLHQRFLKKYPKESDSYTFIADNSDVKSFEFKDHKLLLNISAENKPNLAPGPVWSAELQAVWDFDKAKFDRVDFKPGKISVRKPEE